MPNQMKHGILTPANKIAFAPARVANIRSRKKTTTTRIRLDKLIRSAKPRICIKRRLGGIGDVLMSTPLIRAIKMTIPHCHLVYATDTQYSQGALADIINHNPFVDELIPFHAIQDAEYDYLVDITATGLSKEKSGSIPPNRIDMFADAVGVDISADPVPIYIIEEKERKKAKAFINKKIPKKNKNTRMVAIQTRSNDARRTWPLDNSYQLIQMLAQDENMHIFVMDWGHSIDKWTDLERSNVHLVMNQKLVDIAPIIDQMDVVIAPDSGILHLAGALQKKIVTIFGPIPPESRINYYANATVLTKKLPCSYCWYSPRCAKSDGHRFDCLTGVTPEMVHKAIYKKITEEYMATKNIVYGNDLTDKNQDAIILVRRMTNGLGDILMTTPALAALKKKYKNKRIEVACKKELWPALQNNPNISKLLDCNVPINPKRYYAVIDISTPCARYESARISSGRTVQKSRVEIFAEATGVRNEITTLKPSYYITDNERKWAQDFIAKTINSNKPKIAIGLRSAELYRDWPEEHFNELFLKLTPHFEIILLDHSREYQFENVIDACGFPLRKAIAILEQCESLITVDTGLLHFGAALEIPTIAIFGPIDCIPRCKGYDKVTVIKSNMDCIPCWRNNAIPCRATGMVRGYSKCLKAISANKVASLAIKKFSEV